MIYERIGHEGRSICGLSEKIRLTPSAIAHHTSRSRDEWVQQKADERESNRAFHDEEGHSWPQTTRHFRLDVSTVKRRAHKACKEREQDAADQAQPPLPLALGPAS